VSVIEVEVMPDFVGEKPRSVHVPRGGVIHQYSLIGARREACLAAQIHQVSEINVDRVRDHIERPERLPSGLILRDVEVRVVIDVIDLPVRPCPNIRVTRGKVASGINARFLASGPFGRILPNGRLRRRLDYQPVIQVEMECSISGSNHIHRKSSVKPQLLFCHRFV